MRRNYSNIPIITEPVPYPAAFVGFGTPTNVNVRSWRCGAYLMVEGIFTIGTATATEAQMSIGYNGVSGNVTTSRVGPALGIAGFQVGDTAGATSFGQGTILVEPSKTYVTFGRNTSGAAGTNKVNGNAFSNSVQLFVFFRVPIEGWSATRRGR